MKEELATDDDNIVLPFNISISLTFLRIFRAHSIIILFLYFLFMQVTFSIISRHSKNTFGCILYLFVILGIVFFLRLLPNSFLEFLFPSYPIVIQKNNENEQLREKSNSESTIEQSNQNQLEATLPQNEKGLSDNKSNQSSKQIKNEDSIAEFSKSKTETFSILYCGRDILCDSDFIKLTGSFRNLLILLGQYLSNINLLVISSSSTIFFGLLLLLRRYSLLALLHSLLIILFVTFCYFGFKFNHSIFKVKKD